MTGMDGQCGRVTVRVLLVDDDAEFCDLLATYLTSQGLRVETVHGGNAALQRLASRNRPDAVCLDFMMPPPNGLEVLRRLRQADDWIPVLFLTANTDETDKIVSLEIGADDYVAKTSSPRELAARLKALMRRASQVADRTADDDLPIEVGDLCLIPSERNAVLGGRPVRLTSTEFGVLHFLMRHAGTVVSKEDLSRSVLGRGVAPYDRALDVHVSHIRKKLAVHDGWQYRIKAVRGLGYQLLSSG